MSYKELPDPCIMVKECLRWKFMFNDDETFELMIEQVDISEINILYDVVFKLDISYLDKLEVTESILNEL